MTDYEMLCLLWNKDVKIGLLKYSFMQVGLWDGDIDYGLDIYNEEVLKDNALTKEEYTNLYFNSPVSINYIKKQKE